MRLRTTLLLLGTTLALVGYIFFHERHLENSRDAAAHSSLVNVFEAAEVNVVRLDGPNGKMLFRRGKDGIWMMLHPVEDRADQQILSDLVQQAAKMTIVERLTLEEISAGEGGGASKPEDLGFGAEEIRVELLRNDSELAAFTVGAATEWQDVHYVAKPGEWSRNRPVLVVLSRLFETVALPVEKLRDPRLIAVGANDLRQIKFAETPTSLMLRRERLSEGGSAFDPAGEPADASDASRTPSFNATPWRLTQPIDTRTDPQRVDDRIAALLGVTIVAFADESTSPATGGELQEGKREIRVWTFSSKSKTIIELTDTPEAEAEGYLLARVTDRPGTLRISRDILKAFTVNPNDLRDPHLADIRFTTVLTAEIRGLSPDGAAAPAVSLARYGGNFALLRRGQKEKADAHKIQELIKALNEEKVEFVAEFAANPALFGLDRPLRVLTITTETPDPAAPSPPPGSPPTMLKTEIVLHIGEGAKPRPGALGRLYARFADAPFVYGISPELLGKLDPQAIRWKSPELLRFSLFDLKGITILRPPQPPLAIAYDAGTNGWTASAAGADVTPDLDQATARAFGEALTFLVASGWTADPETALKRIQEETILDITARIENRQESKVDEVRLRIAPPSPGLVRSATYYGQLNELGDVFLVDRATFNRLNTNLLKQPAAPSPPAPDAPPSSVPAPESESTPAVEDPAAPAKAPSPEPPQP